MPGEGGRDRLEMGRIILDILLIFAFLVQNGIKPRSIQRPLTANNDPLNRGPHSLGMDGKMSGGRVMIQGFPPVGAFRHTRSNKRLM